MGCSQSACHGAHLISWHPLRRHACVSQRYGALHGPALSPADSGTHPTDACSWVYTGVPCFAASATLSAASAVAATLRTCNAVTIRCSSAPVACIAELSPEIIVDASCAFQMAGLRKQFLFRACVLRCWSPVYGDHRIARVRIAHDSHHMPVPAPIAAGAGHWLPWVAQQFDARALAARACELHAAAAPGMAVQAGTAEATSFALTAAMDLPWTQQYLLFCMPTSLLRLRKVCVPTRASYAAGQRFCRACAPSAPMLCMCATVHSRDIAAVNSAWHIVDPARQAPRVHC